MRILLATDGTPHARAAEEWVIGLPLAWTDSVSVVTVVPEESWQKLGHVVDRSRDPQEDARPERPSAAAEIAERVRERLAARVRETGWMIRVGSPSEQILQTIDEIRPDLVVIGCRGRNARQRVVLGSVAERVAREAACSVAVVRSTTTPQRILLAVDQSFQARGAVEVLARLPLPPDISIVMLAVMPPLKPAMLAAHTVDTSSGLLKIREEERRLAQAIARAAEGLFGSAGWRIDVRFAEGDPSKTIAEAAAQHGVDLIVVDAAPQCECALPLASVARRTLRYARSSVLIARAGQHVDAQSKDSAATAVQTSNRAA